MKLKHQIVHRHAIFQAHVKAGLVAVPHTSAQHVQEAISYFNAAILFHLFQLIAANLHAEPLELANCIRVKGRIRGRLLKQFRCLTSLKIEIAR